KTVVIEWNAGTTDGKALLDFAAQSNIARAYFNLVALNENGEPMIIQDADITDPNDNAELPQTGYSDIYKAIEGLATLMTVGGAALVVKTRKENE
ncbi:MAG: LPXTG cell wall anchor domain-containing protein, partial [Oscillospiraceae bacterium]|nr:LPXTG cell wall anchor domain-containing protein [Oscillospiraceae bacterium]